MRERYVIDARGTLHLAHDGLAYLPRHVDAAASLVSAGHAVRWARLGALLCSQCDVAEPWPDEITNAAREHLLERRRREERDDA